MEKMNQEYFRSLSKDFKYSLLINDGKLINKRYSNSGHLITTYQIYGFCADLMIDKESGEQIRIWVRQDENTQVSPQNVLLPDALFLA